MDAGTADTINRRDVQLIAAQLDKNDLAMPVPEIRWPHSAMADTLVSDAADSNGDRAWLVGHLAARTPGTYFDGAPADADWENLFGHFRAEIQTRRDPETPHIGKAETRPGGVV
jgi:hypothetical protein